MDYTESDADTLAEKLGAMDLSDGERSALDTVFGAAGGEVEGFTAIRTRPNQPVQHKPKVDGGRGGSDPGPSGGSNPEGGGGSSGHGTQMMGIDLYRTVAAGLLSL